MSARAKVVDMFAWKARRDAARAHREAQTTEALFSRLFTPEQAYQRFILPAVRRST